MLEASETFDEVLLPVWLEGQNGSIFRGTQISKEQTEVDGSLPDGEVGVACSVVVVQMDLLKEA